MTISFEPLKESHFSILLKWLEEPHVKVWWDREVKWTPRLVQEKYSSYVKGYKLEDGKAKVIQAYIIKIESCSVGYIQFYNAYDFNREIPLIELPKSLAAFDMFIGETAYLRKGIGSVGLKTFLENFVDPYYKNVFADPDRQNTAAIKTYDKVGFKKFKNPLAAAEVWMLREKHVNKI